MSFSGLAQKEVIDSLQKRIAVEDDGKGFEVSVLDKAQGIGWRNIQGRVNLL